MSALSLFIEDKLYKQQMNSALLSHVRSQSNAGWRLFASSQRVLVLVDHMHVDCSLLPQGVLHLVLHMLGNGRLVDRVVGVDDSGEDALAVSVGNLHRNNEKVHKDLKKKESPWNDIYICPPSCPSACHPEKKRIEYL